MITDIKTAFFIAYKSILKGNRSTMFLLIFILSLSFLNLMFIAGIMKGLTSGMTKSIIDTSLGHITISPQVEPTKRDYIDNQDQLVADIKTIPGIVGVTRHYKTSGQISFDKEKNGKFETVSASIVGIDPNDERKVLTTYQNITSGKFLDGTETDEIVISSSIAGGGEISSPEDNLGGAKVGDRVMITFAGGYVRHYKIKGIFEVSMGGASQSVFVSSKEAESILGVYNNASEIVVRVDESRDTIENYYQRIKAMAPNLKIQPYSDLLSTIGTMLSAFDLIATIVGIISIIVAAVTIFVLIYVNAVNKRRQIGILKAIGIKESIIEISYIFQSVFYAICSVGMGSILVFGVLSPLLKAHPIALPFGDAALVFTNSKIITSVASMLISGLVAGYLPARIVAKQSILDAIWG